MYLTSYQSTPCRWLTPGWSNGRPGGGRPRDKFGTLDPLYITHEIRPCQGYDFCLKLTSVVQKKIVYLGFSKQKDFDKWFSKAKKVKVVPMIRQTLNG
jgi:hypothetical protein